MARATPSAAGSQPFPHSSQIDGELRELRELRSHYGHVLYRILYRRSLNLIIPLCSYLL